MKRTDLIEVLRPFAEEAKGWSNSRGEDDPMLDTAMIVGTGFTVGDLRRAREVLRAFSSSPAPLRMEGEEIERALCREKCAHRGELPCFAMLDDQGEPLPWPNPNCDDPGCHAEAEAVRIELSSKYMVVSRATGKIQAEGFHSAEAAADWANRVQIKDHVNIVRARAT